LWPDEPFAENGTFFLSALLVMDKRSGTVGVKSPPSHLFIREHDAVSPNLKKGCSRGHTWKRAKPTIPAVIPNCGNEFVFHLTPAVRATIQVGTMNRTAARPNRDFAIDYDLMNYINDTISAAIENAVQE
jgi:hypothetical protein